MKGLSSILWLLLLAAPACGAVEGDRLRALGFLVQEGFEEAPAFATVDASGAPVALEDYRGKVVLLNFWATWCPPCRREMPDMERLYREFRGQGLEVVAVNLMETPAQVRAFAQAHKLSYPMWLDPGGEAAGQYGVMRLPETIIIGRRGELIAKGIGYKPWYNDDMRALMAALVERGAAPRVAAAARDAVEAESAGAGGAAYLAGAAVLAVGVWLLFRRRRIRRARRQR